MKENHKIIVGVDGGGTRTRVAIARTDGTVINIAESGPTNYGAVSLSDVRDNITTAWQTACDVSGIGVSDIDAAFLGIAGVTSDLDRQAIKDVVKSLNYVQSGNISVDHDIRIALAGGLAGDEGLALIAGTGSSCYGRRNDGKSWQAGGWAHLVDDFGSSYRLAVDGLIAAVKGADGRGSHTSLTKTLFQAIKIDELPEIIGRLHRDGLDGNGPMTKTQIASLAPIIVDQADSGDKCALEIVDSAVYELLLMLKAAASNLELDTAKLKIAVTGGLASNETIKNKLNEAVEIEFAGAKIQQSVFSPVIGAVILAISSCGVEITDSVIDKLKFSGRINK